MFNRYAVKKLKGKYFLQCLIAYGEWLDLNHHVEALAEMPVKSPNSLQLNEKSNLF
jgi:hypothetical protein